MTTHFQKMFAYNAWAIELFLHSLESQTIANARVYLLLSHILNAEEVWFCRLQLLPAPNENIWKEYSLPLLRIKALEQSGKWEQYLQDLEPLEYSKRINYQNSKGQSFTTEVSDILNHVVNHGTYHRAQIASLLKLEAIIPPVSDYIAYIRQMEK